MSSTKFTNFKCHPLNKNIYATFFLFPLFILFCLRKVASFCNKEKKKFRENWTTERSQTSERKQTQGHSVVFFLFTHFSPRVSLTAFFFLFFLRFISRQLKESTGCRVLLNSVWWCVSVDNFSVLDVFLFGVFRRWQQQIFSNKSALNRMQLWQQSEHFEVCQKKLSTTSVVVSRRKIFSDFSFNFHADVFKNRLWRFVHLEAVVWEEKRTNECLSYEYSIDSVVTMDFLWASFFFRIERKSLNILSGKLEPFLGSWEVVRRRVSRFFMDIWGKLNLMKFWAVLRNWRLFLTLVI